jgi:hypothetical protein
MIKISHTAHFIVVALILPILGRYTFRFRVRMLKVLRSFKYSLLTRGVGLLHLGRKPRLRLELHLSE